jgi:taurine dioxygenase
MTISVQRVTAAIGAEISGVDLSRPISEGDKQSLLKALSDYHVIFLRHQKIGPQQQLEFSRIFGEIDSHPANKTIDNSPAGVQILEYDGTSERGTNNDQWHSDVSFLPKPYRASVLRADVIPPLGGETLWCSAYAAYEALAGKLQRLFDGMEAVHSWSVDAAVRPPKEEYLWGTVHPAVRVIPETGRKCLYVNEMWTRRLLGVSASESQLLLRIAYDCYRVPEHQVRFRWELGDIVVWDNRCTTHYANQDFKARRVMHRVSLVGDVPLGPQVLKEPPNDSHRGAGSEKRG